MENRLALKTAEQEYTSFDFDAMEIKLTSELELQLAQLQVLEKERANIGNPDALSKVVMNEVWTQFSNQIGLDLTDETLIQEYDREYMEQHGKAETYEDAGKEAMADKRYKDANKQMKKDQESGNLNDAYTGKKIKQGDKANLDHVVSRKEIYENARRKQAKRSTADLANKEENLKATNEALNKSKGKKSVEEYTHEKKREQRETDLIKQNERANKKIDESNMSEADKKAAKAKNNKKLQDKLDADSDKMRAADKEAREAINKEIFVGASKEIGKKAIKDAAKTMMVSSLSTLLKEMMNGFVRFMKAKAKSFKVFIGEIKQSIKNFFKKLSNIFKTGATSVLGTIITELLDPIIGMFKKFASLIKQGVSSFVDAIKYLTSSENKNKPFSEKVAQVGKIIVGGITAGGAIILGEVLEKILLTVPFMQMVIPLVGTLANIVGMFIASVVCGVIGAIAINKIDKFLAERQKNALVIREVEKKNEIILTQNKLIINEIQKIDYVKTEAKDSMSERHSGLVETIKESYTNAFGEKGVDKDLNALEEIKKKLGNIEGKDVALSE